MTSQVAADNVSNDLVEAVMQALQVCFDLRMHPAGTHVVHIFATVAVRSA